jgi:hypothetical protein
MLRLIREGHEPLRYEDRFFDDPASVERIARALGLALPQDRTDAIFSRYRTEAVRSFASQLDALPEERIAWVGDHKMDIVTQIHAPHIGDATSGKWRDLPSETRDGMTNALRPLLNLLGYEA